MTKCDCACGHCKLLELDNLKLQDELAKLCRLYVKDVKLISKEIAALKLEIRAVEALRLGKKRFS